MNDEYKGPVTLVDKKTGASAEINLSDALSNYTERGFRYATTAIIHDLASIRHLLTAGVVEFKTD